MKTFKQWISYEYGGHTFVFFRTDDERGKANAEFLIEMGRTWDIDNRWSVRMDSPHAPNMQKHNHIIFKGNEVSVINRDGTQSHNTTSDSVPKWIMDKIKKKGWITEGLLVEANGQEIRISRELIDRVHVRAYIRGLARFFGTRFSLNRRR